MGEARGWGSSAPPRRNTPGYAGIAVWCSEGGLIRLPVPLGAAGQGGLSLQFSQQNFASRGLREAKCKASYPPVMGLLRGAALSPHSLSGSITPFRKGAGNREIFFYFFFFCMMASVPCSVPLWGFSDTRFRKSPNFSLLCSITG